MNTAHLHLEISHFPIAGLLFGSLILSYGILNKNSVVVRVSLVLFITTMLLAAISFVSGTTASESVQEVKSIDTAFMEKHEQWASAALWLLSMLAVASFGILTVFTDVPRWILIIINVYALLVFIAFITVDNLGVQVAHQEIRGK
jgi:cell division protein FtsW (lipid II flippase)